MSRSAIGVLAAGAMVTLAGGCWGPQPEATPPADRTGAASSGPAEVGRVDPPDASADATAAAVTGEDATANVDPTLLARAEQTYQVADAGDGFRVRTHKSRSRSAGARRAVREKKRSLEAAADKGAAGGPGGGMVFGHGVAPAEGGGDGGADLDAAEPMPEPEAEATPAPRPTTAAAPPGAPARPAEPPTADAPVAGSGGESYDDALGAADRSADERLSRLEETERARSDEHRPKAQIQAAPLRAGETDDNEAFDEYLTYRIEAERNAALKPLIDPLDVTERYVIRVTDENGRPLPNTLVSVTADDTLLWQGRTTSAGTVPFYPRCVPAAEGKTDLTLSLVHGDTSAVHAMKRKKHGQDEPLSFQLPCEKGADPVALDVLFVIDTTGSMGDEIRQIQATLLQITQRIENLPSKPALRFGMVLYRDRTDAYVTKVHPFTEDVTAFNRALQTIQAQGGGDGPEALNMGLHDAVHEVDWSRDALRLAFLVADAPPHMDYGDDVPYGTSLRAAVRKGIKVFPVAASGLDRYPHGCGTYIFRQIAQFTMARFIYIEYGSAGASAKSHGVARPSAQSNNLDDIVLRTVERELAAYAE